MLILCKKVHGVKIVFYGGLNFSEKLFSVGFLCNLSQASKGILIYPQSFWFIIINLILLLDSINLHPREHGTGMRGLIDGKADSGSEYGTCHVQRTGLRTFACTALSVSGIMTVGPLLVVGVVGEHGLDVQPLHPVPQGPGGDVVLHTRPVD